MAMRSDIGPLHHHVEEAMRVVFHGRVKIVVDAQPLRTPSPLDQIVEQNSTQNLNAAAHLHDSVSGSVGRLDIGIETKEIHRIILALNRRQLVIVPTVGSPDAFGPIFGVEVINHCGAGSVWLDFRSKLAYPAHMPFGICLV